MASSAVFLENDYQLLILLGQTTIALIGIIIGVVVTAILTPVVISNVGIPVDAGVGAGAVTAAKRSAGQLRDRGAAISTIKKICDGLEISIQEFFESEIFMDLEQELQ